MRERKRIGVLTGGGDCPGLNAVIRAVVKTAENEYDIETVGFLDGYEGLVENRYRALHPKDLSGLLSMGGTILGTSNRADPFRFPMLQGDEYVYLDRSNEALLNFEKLGLETLIAIGGDGTMAASGQLHAKGLPVIGVPKTIDNDLPGTEMTFGFDSALNTAIDAIDKIHSTAQSHHRVMIIEVMGRYAGWLALGSGLAGGGDIILIPEIPYDVDAVCEQIRLRRSQGKNFSIVVVGEGAKPAGGDIVISRLVKNSPDKVRLGGISHQLAAQLEAILNIECRVTILGHLLRGGPPSAFDRMLATQLGVEAVHRAVQGESGVLVSWTSSGLRTVPLKEITGRLRKVTPDHAWVKTAQAIGVSLGVPAGVAMTDYLATVAK